jgi:hypothetical protein
VENIINILDFTIAQMAAIDVAYADAFTLLSEPETGQWRSGRDSNPG